MTTYSLSVPREYCAHCARELGAIRVVIVGSNATLHPDCLDVWKRRNQTPPATDTSNWNLRP